MRIEGPNLKKSAKSAKAKSSSGSGGVEFGRLMGEASKASSEETSPVQHIASMVDALWTLQEQPERDSLEQKALDRGELLLEQLEQLQLSIIEGRIGASALATIQSNVKKRATYIQDIRLKRLLNDIETRIEVELAKLELSLL